jgi:hypothetical protein
MQSPVRALKIHKTAPGFSDPMPARGGRVTRTIADMDAGEGWTHYGAPFMAGKG